VFAHCASDAEQCRNRLCRGFGDHAVSTKEGDLARLLRQAQWMLDDAAFAIPEGRCSAEEQRELAEMLDQLASLMHQNAARSMVIDAPPGEGAGP
jgi:hypothetical protein